MSKKKTTTTKKTNLRGDKLQQFLATPVMDLDLPLRARRSVGKLGVRTVRDLLAIREDDVRNQPNSGDRTVDVLRDFLARYKLGFAEERAGVVQFGTCGECLWSRERSEKPEQLQCYFNPPTPVLAGNDFLSIHSPVEPDDTCAHFAPFIHKVTSPTDE